MLTLLGNFPTMYGPMTFATGTAAMSRLMLEIVSVPATYCETKSVAATPGGGGEPTGMGVTYEMGPQTATCVVAGPCAAAYTPADCTSDEDSCARSMISGSFPLSGGL